MDRYTFDDYKKYLQMESGLFGNGLQLWKSKSLQESKGIIDDYDNIIKEIYNSLIATIPIPFNNDICYLMYNLDDYNMIQDCFIKNLTVNVFTNSNGDNSYFDGGKCNLIQDGEKLSNVVFGIYINNKFLNSENGKNEFFLTMTHELQHAYRFFNICLTNQSCIDKENNKKEIYRRSLIDGSENNLEMKVKTIYYISERDEIMSEANKLFEYIKQTKELNIHTLKDYENDSLPLYTIVMSLKNTVEMFDTFVTKRNKYEDLIKKIGEIFNKITNENITPSVGFVKLRNKIINAAMFADRKYHRTLAYAFKKFNRYAMTENFSALNTIMDWKDIIEEHNQLNENF